MASFNRSINNLNNYHYLISKLSDRDIDIILNKDFGNKKTRIENKEPLPKKHSIIKKFRKYIGCL